MQAGRITQGEVIALVNYMTQILLALVALANLIVSFTKAMASAGRINEVFDLEPGITDGAGLYKTQPKRPPPRILRRVWRCGMSPFTMKQPGACAVAHSFCAAR